MAFKVFPATLTRDGQKVPLISGWQQAATDDPQQLNLWREVFKDRWKFWGVPTGRLNNIYVLDVDVKPGQANGYETIKQHPVPETFSQPTPSGGRHFFFKYPEDGRVYGNTSKFLPGLDTRGEGGWVAFYGFDAGKQLADPPQWVLAGRNKAQTEPVQAARVAPEIALKVIQESLDAIRNAPPGESNDTLNRESFKVGQLVAGGSVSREFAEAELFKAAKERGKPDYEARATITSGLDGGGAKPIVSPFGSTEPVVGIAIPPPPAPASRWTPQGISHFDLLDTSKLRKPQLFKDWSTEDLTLTVADGGTGKTTLALYESVCLALGERFLGFDCLQPGARTLYITGEDTEKKLSAMVGSIARQMGLLEETSFARDKLERIRQSIFIKKDADLCLIAKDRQGFIHSNPDAVRKLNEAIEDIQPKRIVLDPISSFWGSEAALNDMARTVTKVLGAITEHGIQVEMINHMGKQSSQNKDFSQFAGRGGTGLPSHSRVVRGMFGLSEEEYLSKANEQMPAGMSAIQCAIDKFSDGSPLYRKPFMIMRQGMIFHRKDFSPEKLKEAQKEMNDGERIFSFVAMERGSGRYPTKSVIEAHFMGQADSISKDRIKRALDVLQYTGIEGDKIKAIDNPDVSAKGQAYTIVGVDGREL